MELHFTNSSLQKNIDTSLIRRFWFDNFYIWITTSDDTYTFKITDNIDSIAALMQVIKIGKLRQPSQFNFTGVDTLVVAICAPLVTVFLPYKGRILGIFKTRYPRLGRVVNALASTSIVWGGYRISRFFR